MTISISTAHDIIANPARYAHLPTVFGAAWAIVMEARGKRVNLDQLGTPRHVIDRAGAGASDTDLRTRIRRHAERQGYPLPRSRHTGPHLHPLTAPPEPPGAA